MSPITGWDETRRKARRGQWRTPATMNGMSVGLVGLAGWVLLTLPLGFGWLAWPVGIGAAGAGAWVNAPRFNPRYLWERHQEKARRRGRTRPARSNAYKVPRCSDPTCPAWEPTPERSCRCRCGGQRCGAWLR